MRTTNNYLNCNPFDEIDKKIKFAFLKAYSLQLSHIYYSTYGIVDSYYLLNLIGDSDTFNVFLAYKEEEFFAVKIMKRSIYETKEAISERIRNFYHELQIRDTLKESDLLPVIYEVNYDKFIIYEEFCNNGKLTFFNDNAQSSIISKSLISHITDVLALLKKFSLEHTSLTLDDFLLDKNLNPKIIGFRKIRKKLITYEMYFESTSVVDVYLDSALQLICKILFKNKANTVLEIYKKEETYTEKSEKLDLTLTSLSINLDKNLFSFLHNILLAYSFDELTYNINELMSTENNLSQYSSEMIKIRAASLNAFYEQQTKKEQRILNKKRGIFHVIKAKA